MRRTVQYYNYKYLYLNDNRINSWYKDSKLTKERVLHKLFFVNEYKNSTRKKNIKRRIDKAIYVNNFYINISHFNSYNWTLNFSYVQNKNLHRIKSIIRICNSAVIRNNTRFFPYRQLPRVDEDKSASPFEYGRAIDSNKRPHPVQRSSIQEILLLSFSKHRKKENPYLPPRYRRDIHDEISRNLLVR